MLLIMQGAGEREPFLYHVHWPGDILVRTEYIKSPRDRVNGKVDNEVMETPRMALTTPETQTEKLQQPVTVAVVVRRRDDDIYW